MSVGASFALGVPRPPPRWRGGLLCSRTTEAPAVWAWGLLRFGTTEAPAAWARGPPLLWDHRCPRCMGARASAGGDDETRVPHDCPGP